MLKIFIQVYKHVVFYVMLFFKNTFVRGNSVGSYIFDVSKFVNYWNPLKTTLLNIGNKRVNQKLAWV